MTAVVAEPAAPPSVPAGGPYAHLSPAERYIHRSRDSALNGLLRAEGIESLAGLRIVELGCGDGALLRTLLYYGAEAGLMRAVDVDPARAAAAHEAAPGAEVVVGDMACLPYRSSSFDLAFAFTSFSAVRDPQARRHAGLEAMRILRQGGLLIVYDFMTNPFNTRVRPLTERELRAMFSRHAVDVRRVTLTPPVVRFLRGRRTLCRPLEQVPFLRTHLLAAVRKV